MNRYSTLLIGVLLFAASPTAETGLSFHITVEKLVLFGQIY